MTPNLFSLLAIVCGTIVLITGIIAICNDTKTKTSQYFFLLSIVTSIWLLTYGALALTPAINTTRETFYRIIYCDIASIPSVFMVYILNLWGVRPNKKLLSINLIILLFCYWIILNTKLIVSGMATFWWGTYPVAGDLHPIFLLYFYSIILIAVFIQHRKTKQLWKEGPSKKSTQAKYFFLALCFYTTASFDFLPNYGIPFPPIGGIGIALFSITVAYASIKHDLMNIKIVIKHSVLYTTLLGIISLIYLLLVVTLENLSKNILLYKSQFATAFAIITIALIFLPLKNRLEYLIDKIFYRGSARELSRENERLRHEITRTERLRSVAILASGLAHEIRNPLTAIQTFAEYLPKKINDKEFLLKFSAIAHKEVNRINALINQLLDFAKPSPLKLKNINVNQLISETLTLLSSNFLTHHIAIEDHLDASPAELQADPNQLKQAILNVLLNAVDAMPEGGTIRVETSHQSPLTSHQSPNLKTRHAITNPAGRTTNNNHQAQPNDQRLATNDSIRITITDTGKGISKQDLPHIFDPFFTKKDSGTGLGLAVTHGIIQQHGGRILVESEVGKGTRFTMEMPGVNRGVGGRGPGRES